MMSTQPSVAIVVLNYNNWKDTIECLESLLRINYNNYKIILVDNSSTDNSIEKIKKWASGELNYSPEGEIGERFAFPPVKKPVLLREHKLNYQNNQEIFFGTDEKIIILPNKRNLGYGGGNNVGIKFALNQKKFDYICILNNDTIVTPNFLYELIKAYDKQTGICGPVIYNYYNPQLVWSSGGKYNFFTGFYYNQRKTLNSQLKPKTTQSLSGTCWLVNSFIFEKIGFIDEEYFLYAEDIDFCYRIRKAGLKLKVIPSSIIYHKVSKTTGNNSPFMLYHFHRSKLKFIMKNYKGLKRFFYLNLNLLLRYIRAFQYWISGRKKEAIKILEAIKDYKK